MRIAILSDIHLAQPPINRCGVDGAKLIDRLEMMRETHDEVIANGDLFDLSRALMPGGWRGQLEATRRAHPEICRALESVRWLYGNHDVQLSAMGVPGAWGREFDGVRIFVHHGHLFDRGLKRFRTIEWGANLVAGWSERLGIRAVERGMEVMSRKSETLASGEEPDVAGARRVLSSGWDVVVQGHAHLQRLKEFEEGIYLNTGSQGGESVEWGSIDSETGIVRQMRDDEIVAEAQAMRTTRR